MMLPTSQELAEYFDYICQKTDFYNVQNGLPSGISRRHYLLVAENAKLIASKTSVLNPEKAYILGLLHDCGEYHEQKDRKNFHGTSGYDEMMALGFDEVARVCLSHSFFEEEIGPEEYLSYDVDCLKRAGELLQKNGFDDYDRLIHLSDLMAMGDRLATIEDRLDYIAVKYHVPEKFVLKKREKSLELKIYFDNLCNEDVYNIVGLNNE